MSEPVTRDNIHLSRPIPPGPPTTSDVNCTESSVGGCSDPKILDFIAAATASSTRRAYHSDLTHFLAWGGDLPATAEQVARYLADHAAVLSMATLARRLAGIRAAHVARGFLDPTKSELVRLTFRGIRRRFGRPQRRVTALSAVIVTTSKSGNSARRLFCVAVKPTKMATDERFRYHVWEACSVQSRRWSAGWWSRTSAKVLCSGQ
jgi:hypothetical protein